MSDGSVFHTVVWSESDRAITMSLGLEGPLVSREVAERCADAYRERLGTTSTRVGVLEMPAPDPRMNHPAPRSDVEQLVVEILGRTR